MIKYHSLILFIALLLASDEISADVITHYTFDSTQKQTPPNEYIPKTKNGETGSPIRIVTSKSPSQKKSLVRMEDNGRHVIALSRSTKDGTDFVCLSDGQDQSESVDVLTLEMVFCLKEARGVTTGGRRNYVRLISTPEIFVSLFDSDIKTKTFSLEIAAKDVRTAITGLPMNTYLHFVLTVDTDGTLLGYIDGEQRAETMKRPGKLHTSLALGGNFPGQKDFPSTLHLMVDELILRDELKAPTNFFKE